MPVHNGERFLRDALDSLLGQDYRNFEIIISDNASIDATSRIAQEYARADDRIRYYSNPTNIGMFNNFNRAFHLTQGDYFMLAGCHDLWDRHFLSRCVQLLDQRASVVLCTGRYQDIDQEGNLLNPVPVTPDTRGFTLPRRLAWVIDDPGAGFAVYSLIRREALAKTRLFLNKYGADYLLVAELSLLGEFCALPETYIYVRTFPKRSLSHEENMRRLMGESARLRFPFTQFVSQIIGIVAGANIRITDKIALVMQCLSFWKGTVLRELVFNSLPTGIKTFLKAAIAKQKNMRVTSNNCL